MGGEPFASSSSNGLKFVLDNAGLTDLGYYGHPFTWSNKRDGGANIQLRLDQGLENSSWNALFPNASVTHIAAISSDHKPLLLNTNPPSNSGRPPFRFEEIKNPSLQNISLEASIQLELDDLFLKEVLIWKSRAKQNWLQHGDSNTRFFHLSATIHHRYNHIRSIEVSPSCFVTDSNDIGNAFVNYFVDLFTSTNPQIPHNLNGLFQSVISNAENLALISIPSPDEIKNVMFSMNSLKSPGPDGFSPLFFKKYWDIVSFDVMKFVQYFFDHGFMLTALNHTLISLIPKTPHPTKVEGFRPISLCNSTYKVISKILASRFKVLLDKFISPSQSAFVPNRDINDNSILSHKIMNFLNNKRKGKVAYMAIKIDLAKAFDRVEWSTLLLILENLGFDPKFIHFIHQCITTSSLSLLVNSTTFGYFKSSRGICQGDPISPFLVITFAKILSRLLHEQELLNQLQGIKIGRNCPPISHVLFADDITIFCRADLANAKSVLHCLNTFVDWSEQLISSCKSFVYFSKNISLRKKIEILHTLNMPECTHRVKHLGLPFCKPPKKSACFNLIMEKMSHKLAGWKQKNLSFAGRITLLKSVAQALPVYQMSTFLLPKHLCNDLDHLMRTFLWNPSQNNKVLALKSWDTICSPKSRGGLGLHRAFDLNKALVGKLAWTLCTYSSKIWPQLLKLKYLRLNSFLDQDSYPPSSSWVWKDIFTCKKLLLKGACFTVTLDSDLRTWGDPWIPSLVNFTPQVNSSFPNPSHLILPLSNRFSSPPPIGSCRLWNLLWSLSLHDRLKVFVWRILSNIIPICGRLNTISPVNEPLALSVITNLKPSITSSLFSPSFRKFEFLTFATVTMSIVWKFRNAITHNSPHPNEIDTAKLAHKLSLDHRTAQINKRIKLKAAPDSYQWHSPPCNWFKINIDASFVNGRTTTAFICRNDSNSVLFGHTSSYFSHDATAVEVCAIKVAFQILDPLSIPLKDCLIFESDSLEAVRMLLNQNATPDWPSNLDLKDAKAILIRHPKWKIRKIPRLGNKAADNLAKWGSTNNSVGCIPPSLLPDKLAAQTVNPQRRGPPISAIPIADLRDCRRLPRSPPFIPSHRQPPFALQLQGKVVLRIMNGSIHINGLAEYVKSFALVIVNNLVRHLVDDGEKLKKKTRKPKPKIPQPQKSHPKQLSDDSEKPKGPSSTGWPLQPPPLYLPIPPPQQPANAELDAILSVVRESEKVVERLQKQEENMLQEVTQRAKDLHDKEFKLPNRKPMPCLDEQDACLKCYKDYAKDPLKCAHLVENFADCARRARQQVSTQEDN
ncbi:hypothetical protein BUALT_Bualt10G0030900 [Buddleja alternifolia]|uniref:Reverse transcriptase domain-containing protein n=1 Tax=Buddleja alternifolia TaxID=168488 RepID=A0AAV6X2W4_9LAMI|nr:hypothetical protein BUALT_Bualt10G0030900 [Buddleja alternifolia]